jgi:hypothetical protein
MLILLCAVFPFLCGPAPLRAQFDSASILGTVRDSTGAVVPNASVTLYSIAKGVSTQRQAGSSGDYEFPNVAPGDYRIVATASGFQQTGTDKFTVNVAARQRVDLTLTIGSASDTVTVTGAATALETDTSDRGETVQGAEAVTLPLNGRSYADLSVLVPGVRKSMLGTVASNPPRDASYNVNGLTSQSNNFELDGIDNNAYQEANQGYSNEAVIPSPDAIQEFKVQTDNYSAEYGRAGGAIINATTRSATNAFHGGAYDYLRNTNLNAFGPFYGTGVKPTLVQNQFGGTFGGPAWKDKLFFFVDYEGLRSVAHLLTTATLPTATELTGLFTSDGTPGGTPIPIKNPYTGAVYANGKYRSRTPTSTPLPSPSSRSCPHPTSPARPSPPPTISICPQAPPPTTRATLAPTSSRARRRTASSVIVSARCSSSSRPAIRGRQAATTTVRSTPVPANSPLDTTGLCPRIPSWNSASDRPGRRAARVPPSSARRTFSPAFPTVPRTPPTPAA